MASTQTAAIVTGAASGIGLRTATRFDADDRFDRVACLDIDDSVEAVADELDSATAHQLDISEFETVGETIDAIEREADILAVVNNAAVSRYFWIGDLTPEEWDRVLNINLKGQYNVVHHAGPRMYAREDGYIVNVSSGAGQRGSASGGVHYSASKAGVLGFTKGLAKQLDPHIRVNCVVPGLIDSPLTTDSGLWTEEGIAEYAESVPLNRLGDPDEVARVIEFLCGEGAAYMTGSVVNVDGGSSLV